MLANDRSSTKDALCWQLYYFESSPQEQVLLGGREPDEFLLEERVRDQNFIRQS